MQETLAPLKFEHHEQEALRISTLLKSRKAKLREEAHSATFAAIELAIQEKLEDYVRPQDAKIVATAVMNNEIPHVIIDVTTL